MECMIKGLTRIRYEPENFPLHTTKNLACFINVPYVG